MSSAERASLRESWQARVAAFRASGLIAAKWCAENQVTESRLWYWVASFGPNNKRNRHHERVWCNFERNARWVRCDAYGELKSCSVRQIKVECSIAIHRNKIWY
ncbi:IS66 family insertion sequence element accessory protein TnpA [Alicyclobacillus hesperidum]|uniref:IS66 family insertion sequence element accessory protein TnpA n=1 Tax=Alicyclobacillus hesperidum TaxID=89784 RepID=UPI000AE7B1B5